MLIERLGEFTLGWGESLVWDDRAERLYFVDCAAHTLHWLDGGRGAHHTMALPSMAAGIVPTEDGRLVGALDEGLYVIDPQDGTTTFLTAYPAGLGARANDACADLSGNLITGTLNLGPAEGSSWWYSARHGWRLLDPDISNTNGPNVCVVDGVMTLLIGDSAADYYAYPYDAEEGTVGDRTVFGDVSGLAGVPDGAALDTDGGMWCALFGGAQLARFTPGGLDRTLELPVANPADVTFGARRWTASTSSASSSGRRRGRSTAHCSSSTGSASTDDPNRASRWPDHARYPRPRPRLGGPRPQLGSRDRVMRMTTSAKPASRCTRLAW